MKKPISFLLIGFLFIETSTAATTSDIDQALSKTAVQTCEAQEKTLIQVEEAYETLGLYEQALAKAQADRPYVETLRTVRNTAAVLTAAAGLVAAYGFYKGQTARGEMSILFAGASRYLGTIGASMAGAATAAAQAGYALTNDDIVSFRTQVMKSRQLIESLRKQMAACR